MVFLSKSPSETKRIGKQLGGILQPGDIVALVGELGTGKTQFIKGLAEGVGVHPSVYVSSPSFTLIHEYSGRVPLYHMDLYRLDEQSAKDLGLEEYFQREGITVMEWADRILALLPHQLLWIHLHYTGQQTRSIEVIPKGKRYEERMNRLRISDCGFRNLVTSDY